MKKYILVVMISLLAACQTHAQDDLRGRIDKRLSVESENMQNVVDVLRLEVMPVASLPDRKEAEEIADSITRLQNNEVGEAGSTPVLRAYGEAVMRFNDLMVRIDPGNFDRHYDRAETYVQLATTIGLSNGLRRPPDEGLILMVDGLKMKAVEASRQLVKNFPQEPDAYGLLAYNTYVIDKKLDEAVKVARQCLEVEKNFQYCKDLVKEFKAERKRLKK